VRQLDIVQWAASVSQKFAGFMASAGRLFQIVRKVRIFLLLFSSFCMCIRSSRSGLIQGGPAALSRASADYSYSFCCTCRASSSWTGSVKVLFWLCVSGLRWSLTLFGETCTPPRSSIAWEHSRCSVQSRVFLLPYNTPVIHYL
jgi:hypothetical protein